MSDSGTAAPAPLHGYGTPGTERNLGMTLAICIIDGGTFTFDAAPASSPTCGTPRQQPRPSRWHRGCYAVTVTNTSGCTASRMRFGRYSTDVAIILSSPRLTAIGNAASASVEIEVSTSAPTTVRTLTTVDITRFASGHLHGQHRRTDRCRHLADQIVGTINTLGGGTLDITAYHSFNADQDASNDTLRASERYRGGFFRPRPVSAARVAVLA